MHLKRNATKRVNKVNTHRDEIHMIGIFSSAELFMMVFTPSALSDSPHTFIL